MAKRYLALALTLALTNVLVAQIVEVGRVSRPGIKDVWSDGTYAYVNSSVVLLTIDISDPTQPTIVSDYDLGSSGAVNDVKVSNGYAYTGTTEIVDLSDPTQPSVVATVPGNGHNVFADGDLLYGANLNSSVPVWDVSDPGNPSLIRNIPVDSGSTVHDITVLDDRLYVSGIGNGKTFVFDVSDVRNSAPPLLHSWVTGSATHSSWVTDDGNTFVNARETSSGDIGIWDISDITNPTLESTIIEADFGANAFSPHNPLIVGDTLYVSWYEAGLRVFDISDPANPVHLGGFENQSIWGVYPFLGPDRILITDWASDEMIIVDVRDILKAGDFDGDSRFTCADIDGLVEQVVNGSDDLHYDANDDGMVNAADVDAWLALAGAANLESENAYLPGDANLDGVVDGGDFVIWNANKFEDHSAWCRGDFTADGVVDGADFIVWNQNKFTTSDITAVPEGSLPVGLIVFAASCVAGLFPRRRV